MSGPVGDGFGVGSVEADADADAEAAASCDGAAADAPGVAMPPERVPVQAAMKVAMPPRAAPLRMVRRETGVRRWSVMCSSLGGRGDGARRRGLDHERVIGDP